MRVHTRGISQNTIPDNAFIIVDRSSRFATYVRRMPLYPKVFHLPSTSLNSFNFFFIMTKPDHHPFKFTRVRIKIITLPCIICVVGTLTAANAQQASRVLLTNDKMTIKKKQNILSQKLYWFLYTNIRASLFVGYEIKQSLLPSIIVIYIIRCKLPGWESKNSGPPMMAHVVAFPSRMTDHICILPSLSVFFPLLYFSFPSFSHSFPHCVGSICHCNGGSVSIAL